MAPRNSEHPVAGVTASAATSRAVWDLLRQRPRATAVAAVLLTLSGLAEGVGLLALLPLLTVATGGEGSDLPAVGRVITDVLAAVGLEATLGLLLLVIVGGMAAKAGLKILAQWQVGAAEASVTADLRRAMIEGFLRARWPYFIRQPAGGLANAVGAETVHAGKVFTKSAELAGAAMLLLVYLVLALLVSWQAALIGGVVGVLAARGLRFLVQISRAAGRDRTTSQDALLSRLNDVLYTIKPVKAMGQERSVMPLLDGDIRQYQRAQRRTVVSQSSVQAVYEPIAALALAVLMYVLLAVLGLPFEELLFAAFLLMRTVGHVGKVQREWQELQNFQYALRVVSGSIADLAKEAEASEGGTAPSLTREVRFDAVDFAYDGRAVLEDFRLTIPARRLTAVIGGSGVGKTTLVDLIIGLQQPQKGCITIDGTSLAEVDLAQWRRQIGYVPQETVLFHDTVQANLTLGDDEISEADIHKALTASGALEFVQELPGGLDSVVGEHGLRLSGGQRQRLAIARALLRQPRLLILDEATTALDPVTEQGILATLEGLRGDLTILAISHQEGVTRSADQIVELYGPGRAPIIRAGGAACRAGD